MRGLRKCGKNFFDIRKEFLPHKEVPELVEFYYLWKKSPQAVTTRYHRRHRRPTTLKRAKTPPTIGAANTAPSTTSPPKPPQLKERISTPIDKDDLSSVSDVEGEDSGDDSDSRDLTAYSCTHCSVKTSKDWHHGGKDNLIVCTECRLFFKKNGEMRPLTESPFHFKPVEGDAELEAANGKHVMKTRRCKEGTAEKSKTGKSREPKGSVTDGEEAETKNGSSKSPVTVSSNKRSGEKNRASSPKLKKKKSGNNEDDSTADKDSLEDGSQEDIDEDMDDVDAVEAKKDIVDRIEDDDESKEKESKDDSQDSCKSRSSTSDQMNGTDIKREGGDNDATTESWSADGKDSNESLVKKDPSELLSCPPLITPKLEPGSSPPPSLLSNTTALSVATSVLPTTSVSHSSSHRSSSSHPLNIESHLSSSSSSHVRPSVLAAPPTSSSPVRVKEERAPSIPSSSLSSQHTRPQSPSRERGIRDNRSPLSEADRNRLPGLPPGIHHPFPFGPLTHGFSPAGRLPSPLSGFPGLPPSAVLRPEEDRQRSSSREHREDRERREDRDREREHRHRDREHSSSDREKDRERRPSSSDARNKSSRESPASRDNKTSGQQSGMPSTSESPRPSPAHQAVSQSLLPQGWPPGFPTSMLPPGIRPGDLGPFGMMPPTSLAGFPGMTPAEQRLPPAAPGHPGFGHPGLMPPHPYGPLASHPFFLPPGLSPHFGPPSGWFPQRPMAGLPGFPTGPSIPSPSSTPGLSSKSKSPAPKDERSSDHHRDSGHHSHHKSSSDRRDSLSVPDDDEPDPTPMIARGPSPEPKVEDSECHRSQSAM